MEPERIPEELKAKPKRQENEVVQDLSASSPGDVVSSLTSLQQQVGNRALQRMLSQRGLVQRSGGKDEAFDLDDETTSRINRERSGGQPLDGSVQAKMSEAMGDDFSDVKVHTTPEAADLSRQVGAVAFTTGKDIFFNQGMNQLIK